MAKTKLDVELEQLATNALKQAFHGEKVKQMAGAAIRAALEEHRESMRQALVEMVSTDENAVGTCEICQAVVRAKYLKRIPTIEHSQPTYASDKDQWIFACSRCFKELEEKGGISRVIRHYNEIYATHPTVEAKEAEAEDVSQSE